MIHQNFKVRTSISLFRMIDTLTAVGSLVVILTLYKIPYSRDYLIIVFAQLAFFLFFSESIQLYRPIRAGQFNLRLLQLFGTLTLSFLFLFGLIFLTKEAHTYSRFSISVWFALTLSGQVGWRLLFRYLKKQRYIKGIGLRRIAIVGLNESGMQLKEEIENHPELGYRFVGFYDDRTNGRLKELFPNLDPAQLGNVNDVVALAKNKQVDKLYICLPLLAERRIANIIQSLGDTTVDVLMVPNFLLRNLMHGEVGHVGKVDTISVFQSPMSGIKNFYKRMFDILFSSAVLIGLSPILIGIALAVKWTSSGSVFFRQNRYGLDGKLISVIKFRSMLVSENADVVVQATKDDERCTPIGALLRRTSLDELPQFYNVLKGDMSVVGPRPHAVAHNEEYRKRIDYYMLRHKVRPGITGWAQVNGWRGETDTLDKMEKRIEYDLEYIRNWSLWLDIKIICLTVYKGFSGKNVY